MRRIHLVGSKNHGKTTLLVELIEAATRRGLRLGAIKHTHHAHELDKPGSDSHRLRHAGAAPAAFVTGSWMGVFQPCEPGASYARLAETYADCDLVVVEGDLGCGATTLEVWRASLGSPPLALSRSSIAAVVTDDPLEIDLPVLPRADIEGLLDQVLILAGVPAAVRARG